MKIISPSVELLQQEGREEGMLKHIERCARTCYKSEDKITDDSAKQFVQSLIKRGHTAMLEHGTVYLTLSINRNNRHNKLHYPWFHENADVTLDDVFTYVQFKFMNNPYSVIKLQTNKDYTETTMCITTNLRVIHENNLYGIMHEFITEPTLYHERRITLKFITNIGVTREGNRHRVNSIAEESTRCCNYSKDKFDNQITYCKPEWIDRQDIEHYNEEMIKGEFDFGNALNDYKCISIYLECLFQCQIAYNNLIRYGWTPEQAREVLPFATKSEVVYTAFARDWKHWFDLRLFGTTGKPHPNIMKVAEEARNILVYNNLWQLIYPFKEEE